MHTTPEGYLLCIGVPIARTGEMIYAKGEIPIEADDDGQIVIEREEKDVFHPKTLASFEGKAVTITHPTDFVGPDNWSRLTKGILQNVRRGEGENKNDMLADLLITDKQAIFLVQSGLREVSCGYEAEYEQLEPGRGRQTSIVGNHLALVEQGRAGSSYAIRDHKGKETEMSKLKDKIKGIFAKAQDEAMALADEANPADKKEEKKAGDEQTLSMDDIAKMLGAMDEKISALSNQGKDADKPEPKKEEKKEEAADEEVAPALEDRLKALEASVAKLLEKMAGESADEDESEAESEDDDMEGDLTGDDASRVEILAPGMKATKDHRAAALKIAYKTSDGKKVIDQLTAGKGPTYTSKENVDMIFVAASELLKTSRADEFSETKNSKNTTTKDSSISAASAVSAEKLNEINSKFYGKK